MGANGAEWSPAGPIMAPLGPHQLHGASWRHQQGLAEATLECPWHELNLPVLVDTHVPTPAPPLFVHKQRPP